MPIVQMPDGQMVELPDNPDPKQLAELQFLAQPQRRSTTAMGLTEEAVKGAARGAIAFPKALTTLTDPVANATITGLRKLWGDKLPEPLIPSQKIENTTQKFLNRIQPAPQASTPEQMLGTGMELGTSGLLFPGSSLRGLAAPVIGGVLGEQVAGDTGKLVGSLAGVAGQVAASRLAQRPNTINALAATTKELHDVGYKFLPSQMSGRNLSRTIEGASGVEPLNNLLRSENQAISQNLAAKATGLAPTDLTAKALDAASNVKAAQGYDPIKRLGSLYMGRAATHPYQSALTNVAKKYSSLDEAQQIAGRVEKLKSASANGRMEPEVALERIRQLRSDASDAFHSDKRNYGRALRELANAMEDQIERNLPTGSRLLDEYKAARVQIAKNTAVKDMLVDKYTGVIDPTKAQKLLEDGVPLTGELETLAKAGSKMYKTTTSPPVKGKGVPFNLGVFGASSGLGAAGFLTGGAVGGIAAAAAPTLARAGGRHILTSNLIQNQLAKNLMQPGTPSLFGAPAQLIQKVPPAIMAPLFSQGEE